MDVNERIVEIWLRLKKKMFTTTEIHFGNSHNDIDILAVRLGQKIEIWDCEVKIRTGSTNISNGNDKRNSFDNYVKLMKSSEREQALKSYFVNEPKAVKKKFITTAKFLGATELNQSKWIKKFNEQGIDVILMEEIVKDLLELASQTKKTSADVIQILKLIELKEDYFALKERR